MSRWKITNRGGSWYVVWTGRRTGCIHDDLSFLTRRRAAAVRDALNSTEPDEQRALYRIWREVRAEQASVGPSEEDQP